MKWGDLPAAAPANSSNPAAPPATSQTSTDVLVVRASRPHDSTAIYEVRARRPHHNPLSNALSFVGQASRLPGGWVIGTESLAVGITRVIL